eukprot:7376600-Prymnesium_polylepis.2
MRSSDEVIRKAAGARMGRTAAAERVTPAPPGETRKEARERRRRASWRAAKKEARPKPTRESMVKRSM